MSETDQFATHKRSSITNRSTTGGVQSGATYQKGRGAVTGPSVVEHTHTTHQADAERAASATAETHQPGEFVTITISREDAGRLANYIDPGSILMAQIRVQEACRAALEAER